MTSQAIVSTVQRLAKAYPVVVVVGPRDVGKTTLVTALFPEKASVNLDNPAERTVAEKDPRGFFDRFVNGVIIDEVQRCPKLFSYLPALVNDATPAGRYIFTASQQCGWLTEIAQSLAGRIGIAQLLPLTLGEITAVQEKSISLDALMLQGNFPAHYSSGTATYDWFARYMTTFLERDLPQMLNIQDPSLFLRFLRLCAGRNGEVLNVSALAGETGIAHTTAAAWLSVLEASYMVHLLQPYHNSFGKRSIKSPKLYFWDTGMLCWLLGIRSPELLAVHPLRGAIFASLVVGEFTKSLFNKGVTGNLFFWRDNNRVGTDLLFESGTKLQPITIKSGGTVTSDYIRAGLKSRRFAPEETLQPWLIYGGDTSYPENDLTVIGWRDMAYHTEHAAVVHSTKQYLQDFDASAKAVLRVS